MSIEEIRLILDEIMKGRKATIYLYGSHARQTATEHSDIDLIVDSKDPTLKLEIMGEFEYRFGNDKDYVCQAITMKQFRRMSEDFIRSAEKDMVIVYEK